LEIGFFIFGYYAEGAAKSGVITPKVRPKVGTRSVAAPARPKSSGGGPKERRGRPRLRRPGGSYPTAAITSRAREARSALYASEKIVLLRSRRAQRRRRSVCTK